MYSNNNQTRTFTIIDFPKDNQTYGKFKSKIPKVAANMAFDELLKHIKIDKKTDDAFYGKFIVFMIKCLKTNKLYKYIGTVVKLKNPVKKMIDGKYITYEYKSVIGKYNKELDKL